MKLFALLVLGSILGLISGALPAADAPAQKAPSFKTADEAAAFAFARIYAVSHWYEYGGVIGRKPDGTFVVSVPRTDHHGTNTSISEDPEDYNYPIVATYHNHPCLATAYSGVFSPPDLSGARSANHPAYMADFCTGEVRRWSPGDGYASSAEMLKLGISPAAVQEGLQLAFGTVVGHITVDGAVIN